MPELNESIDSAIERAKSAIDDVVTLSEGGEWDHSNRSYAQDALARLESYAHHAAVRRLRQVPPSDVKL